MITNFTNSFEDMTVPDSSKYGAGAVAFSTVRGDKEGNALLELAKLKLLSSPLTTNIRIVSGLLESISSYDEPQMLRNYISKCLTATNSVSFYTIALSKLFRTFKYAKIALQYLLLSTQGMTERELRLALGKRNVEVDWIEFCFSVEPAFVCRSGIFLKIANRHVCEALQTFFEDEYDRIQRSKDLIHLWETIIMPANRDELSVVLRGGKEKSSLLYRSWQAYPSLTSIDATAVSKFSKPSWEQVQLFRKSQHQSRDALWTLISKWEPFVHSLSQTNTKHFLLHYLKVLPKKKDSLNYIGMVQLNFINCTLYIFFSYCFRPE